MRALAVAVALVAFAAIALPVAEAQSPSCAKLTLTHAPASVNVLAGGEGQLTFTAKNEAPTPPLPGADLALSLRVSVTPTGWTATAAKSAFTVKSGESQTIVVTVRSPENAPADQRATVDVVADGACAFNGNSSPAGQVSARDSAQALVEAPPGALGLPADVLPILGVLLAVATIGIVAVAITRRKPAVFAVTAPEPSKGVRAGRGASFPLVVANKGRASDTVSCSIGAVPEGWAAFMTTPEAELNAGETRTLYLMARAPAGAPEGTEASLAVTVRSRATGRDTLLNLTARVVEDTAETASATPA